ncbi:TIGR04372 family glycosyltransferase [Daejeonella sp.]|uniref:TIGR04372 family glycosyltransferase n=1 Tax=Daejeonella sp. TaxID=2805397 RepID=UPI0030C5E521
MFSTFKLKKQIEEIKEGGHIVLLRKLENILFVNFLFFIPAIPIVLIVRLVRPWYLIRFQSLISSRIGHFAANTELYLFERDAGINVPSQRYVDVFYFGFKPICNEQLAKMWKDILMIMPRWLISPIDKVNQLIPGGKIHQIGNNTQHDRDVHNLRERFPPYLRFTEEEEELGSSKLHAMGIAPGSRFVCLSVRDSAYHVGHSWAYHDYRNSTINNYRLAAESLADQDYYVLRVGKKVLEPFETSSPKIIDYANGTFKSDFMDIFIASKCEFFISNGEGLVCIPKLFRRPICCVNLMPIGYSYSYINNLITISKHYTSKSDKKELSLSEIFTRGIGFSLFTSEYQSEGIELLENTPEEILDVVTEMVERINSTWQSQEEDEDLQKKFWEIFPTEAVDERGIPLHGKIRGRYGAHFLRNNKTWLQ